MSKINVHREEWNKNFPGKEQRKKIHTLQDRDYCWNRDPTDYADTQEKQNSGEVWKLNWGQKLEVLHDQLKSLDFLFYPIY